MKAEILQQFLVKALTECPKDLEAEFKVCHGVAVRAKHKLESLNSLGLTIVARIR